MTLIKLNNGASVTTYRSIIKKQHVWQQVLRLADSRKLEIHVDDIFIENVSEQKLLGVFIDENLN